MKISNIVTRETQFALTLSKGDEIANILDYIHQELGHFMCDKGYEVANFSISGDSLIININVIEE